MDTISPLALAYPLAANEEERLAELYEQELIGSGRIEQIDRVAALARDLFGVPVALVTLLDRHRQVFLATSGVEITECAREDALCNHTILQDEVLVVPDTMQDMRFRSNTFVTGPTAVRFYAGTPLTIRPGVNLGSLCLIGMEPREFGIADAAHLQALASIVVNEMRGRKASLDLKRREALLAQTARMAKVGGWEFSAEKDAFILSDDAFRMCGLERNDSVTKDAMLKRVRDPHARAAAAQDLAVLLTRGTPFDVEVQITTTDGTPRWIRSQARAEKNSDGAVTRITGAVQDISERKQAEARIEELAYRDALTALPNRALFQKRLDATIAQATRSATRFGLMIFGLDHFKDVNDTLGHEEGDALLRQVAKRLAATFPACATLARLGSDEFAVVVERIGGTEELLLLARRFIEEIKQPHQDGDHHLAIGASCGATIFPDHGRATDQILQNAEVALYRGKTQCRGDVLLFDPAMRTEIDARAKLVRDIRIGIGNGEFVLHYQPVVRVSDRRLCSFEALMRWKHPERGVLPPAAFIAGLEDSELSVALGEVALDTALAQMRSWLDAGVAFGRIAVNLSGAQFRTPDLAGHILAKLDHHRVPAHHLTLEVTETVYVSWGAASVASTVRRLHQAGISIALDDFGTGYASLAHLRQFPIDYLKIDKSFVQSPENAGIVDAVINLGMSLGMQVVAEGVELHEQFQLLRLKGCDMVQGYLFAKPMETEAVAEYIRCFSPMPAAPLAVAS